MRKNNDSQTAAPRQRKYGWRHMVRERSWAVLNIIVGITMLANVSSIGAIMPQNVSAVGGPPPAADLDQCANGGVGDPANSPCDWENGNLNKTKSHYVEGDSVAYRMVFTNLNTAVAHSVTVGYDIKHSDKHAIDYLTNYNRIAETVTPCGGVGTGAAAVSPCVAGTGGDIPTPGNATALSSFNNLETAEGNQQFSIWNGNVTGASYIAQGDVTLAQSEAQITINFTATNSTVVLAWGGHIGSRLDWGIGNSAGGISGSPYHMRLKDLDGAGGNQDRSLSANAIVVPATIIVKKITQPSGAVETFDFTGALAGSIADGQILSTTVQPGATYSVTESSEAGWSLTGIICDDNTGSQSDVTPSNYSVGTRTATFDVSEGENVTCEFTNTRDTGSITVNKLVDADGNGTYEGSNTQANTFGFDWGLDGATPARDMGTTATGLYTDSYDVAEDSVDGYHFTGWFTTGSTQYSCASPEGNSQPLSVSVTKDANSSVTLCNQRDTGDLKIIKLDQVGQPMSGVDFTVDGAPYSTDGNGEIVVNNLPTDDYTVTEIEPVDYAFTSVSGLNCTNGNPSTATVVKDATTTCTFTNTRDQGTIELQKVWSGIPGSTTLTITDSQQQVVDIQAVVGQNDSTGKTTVDTGTFYMSETGGLSDYTASALVCYDDTNGNSLNDNETPVAVGQGDSVNVGQGQNVVCSYTNTRNTGTVTVHKMVDTDADGTFEGDNTVANNLGFAWGIDAEVPARPMGSSQGLNTGDYTVSENSVSGYHFVGWAYGESNGEFNPCNDANSQLPVPITVVNGQTTDVTFCNARDSGTITVLKNVDENGDGDTTDAGDVVGSTSWTWDILSGAQNSATGSSQKVLSGSHVISEDQQAGYHVTGLVCTDNRQTLSIAVSESATVTVANGSNITCTFTNTKNVTTITLDKTGPATATPGQSFTYSLAWTVAGNTSATNAVITDPLPANTTFVSATNGGTFAAGNVTWNLGTQTPPASGTVSVTVIVNPGLTSSTTLTNTGTFDTDQTPPVNDTVVTTVTVPQVLGVSAEANLGITKSVDQPIANPGDTVTYTIVVSNTGDADATNVVVTDNLPDGFTFVDSGKATKTWSLGTLAAGASETLTYQVKVGGSVTAGEYINRAFVTADFFDPIAAEAIVTVKVPQVLGLATTGAGLKDLVIFFLGIGLLGAGFIGFQQLRRRSATTA